MNGPRPPAGPPSPATPVAASPTGPVTVLDWDTYLNRLDGSAREAETALAAGDPFSWPDLALPRAQPTAVQRERADRLRERMSTMLEAAIARRAEILQELSTLATARPRPTAGGGVLGASLDVVG